MSTVRENPASAGFFFAFAISVCATHSGDEPMDSATLA